MTFASGSSSVSSRSAATRHCVHCCSSHTQVEAFASDLDHEPQIHVTRRLPAANPPVLLSDFVQFDFHAGGRNSERFQIAHDPCVEGSFCPERSTREAVDRNLRRTL